MKFPFVRCYVQDPDVQDIKMKFEGVWQEMKRRILSFAEPATVQQMEGVPWRTVLLMALLRPEKSGTISLRNLFAGGREPYDAVRLV